MILNKYFLEEKRFAIQTPPNNITIYSGNVATSANCGPGGTVSVFPRT